MSGARAVESELASPQTAGQLLLALTVVLAACWLCGALAGRAGLPRVAGEITGGLLLGPSALGALAPGLAEMVFPPAARQGLGLLGQAGLAVYMFTVGARARAVTNTNNTNNTTGDQRTGRALGQAAWLALGGGLPALLLGLGVGYWAGDQLGGAHADPYRFALYLGCAFSVTALPVLARLLDEAGLAESRLGRLTLLSAAVTDVVAWSLLALVTGGSGGSGWSAPLAPLAAVGGTAALVGVAWLLARPVLGLLAGYAEGRGGFGPLTLALAALVILAMAGLESVLGGFAAFGAFVTGLCAPDRPRLRAAVQQRLARYTDRLLLPAFFAVAGLSTQLTAVSSPAVLAIALGVLVAATVSKYGGSLLAARLLGFGWRSAGGIAALMNSRGVMELVVAAAGLASGLVNAAGFCVLVLLAVVSTAVALPLYRWSAGAAPAAPRS